MNDPREPYHARIQRRLDELQAEEEKERVGVVLKTVCEALLLLVAVTASVLAVYLLQFMV